MNQAQKTKLYANIAKQVNDKLGYIGVEVLDTSNHDKYCDTVSLYVKDDLYDMWRSTHDKSTIELMDGTFTVGKKQYYIEPYTTTLLNLAVL